MHDRGAQLVISVKIEHGCSTLRPYNMVYY